MLWCPAAKTIILLTSGRSVLSNTCTPNVWFLLAWLYILYEKMTSLPGEESEMCNIPDCKQFSRTRNRNLHGRKVIHMKYIYM